MAKYIAFAALAGFFLPLQALFNARTSAVLGGPFWAALVNFAGGLIFLIPLIFLLRLQVPALEQAARVPWFAWFAGFAGVLFVAQAAYTIPKLGAAGMTAVVIAGQMFGSMAFDHYGVLQQTDAISVQKVLGALLLIAGVWLILRPAAQ